MSGRLTNLPAAVRGRGRTVADARAALLRYQQDNEDLSPTLTHYLGVAAIARSFPSRVLAEATGMQIPRAFYRDVSWRWWNVLLYSGLSQHWKTFSATAEVEGIRKAAQWLRSVISANRYRLFLRRAGTNPHNSRRASARYVWTKGGAWDLRSPMTVLLVLHHPLSPREQTLRWQQRLGDKGVRLIEKELMRLIDPDTMLLHEAKHRAVEYVCHRIGQLLKRRTAHLSAAAWFFGCKVPGPRGDLQWVGARRRPGYIEHRSSQTAEQWSWA